MRLQLLRTVLDRVRGGRLQLISGVLDLIRHIITVNGSGRKVQESWPG
jgi:hypothetical protein